MKYYSPPTWPLQTIFDLCWCQTKKTSSDVPFHTTIYLYTKADWDSFRSYIAEAPLFKNRASRIVYLISKRILSNMESFIFHKSTNKGQIVSIPTHLKGFQPHLTVTTTTTSIRGNSVAELLPHSELPTASVREFLEMQRTAMLRQCS